MRRQHLQAQAPAIAQSVLRNFVTIGLCLLIATLSGACDEGEPLALDDPPGPVTIIEGEGTAAAPMAMAIDTLGFSRETESGVAPGFNLDGRISTAADQETCGNGDFTSPDGVPGVDNQLAVLTPLFDLVGLGAIEDLVQRSIEEGGLLIMYELSDVEDFGNDDSVTLQLKIGKGTPLLGTDGLLLSGQTFRESPDYPPVDMPNAKIVDGVLTAGPFDVGLPIQVFGVDYALDIKGTNFRAELTYDGGLAQGMLGGAVPMANLWALADIASMEAGGIIEAVTLILDGIADLAPDDKGVCTAMSGTFQFSAVSAFFYDE